MNRYFKAIAILLLSLTSNICLAQSTDSVKVVATLNKCWRAIGHEYSSIYGLEEDEIKTTKLQEHIPNSVGIKYNCIHEEYTKPIKRINNPRLPIPSLNNSCIYHS